LLSHARDTLDLLRLVRGIVIESWRRHYNTLRPHGSLGYKPPAPEVFVPALAARPAFGLSGEPQVAVGHVVCVHVFSCDRCGRVDASGEAPIGARWTETGDRAVLGPQEAVYSSGVNPSPFARACTASRGRRCRPEFVTPRTGTRLKTAPRPGEF